MKYLRKFNERKHISELHEICQEHLIGLIDKGFDVDMSYHGYLAITKENNGVEESFKWDNVKDEIINFVEVFYEELEMKRIFISLNYLYDTHEEKDLIEVDKNELEDIKILDDIEQITIEMEMDKYSKI